jgi:oligopeptide transport system permease protein
MGKYILQRIAYMLLTLLIIASITFFLMKLLPSSPFKMQDKLTDAQLESLYEQYGLNDPVPIQYLNYLGDVARGDLGISFQFDNRKVEDIIGVRIGPSAQLGVQSLLVGSFLGILLGLFAALRRNSIWDYSANIVAIFGISIPSFVFAGLLQYNLAVAWPIFPVSFWDSFAHTILPTISLAIGPIAICSRFLRTEMMEVLGSDYIELARAKGISARKITYKHALRNALIPIITIMGPMVVGLVTGSLVIEKIFAIPGIGEQFVQSIMTNDFPVIMGTTLYFSVLFVAVILIIDILYVVVDPRIRLTGGKG